MRKDTLLKNFSSTNVSKNVKWREKITATKLETKIMYQL